LDLFNCLTGSKLINSRNEITLHFDYGNEFNNFKEFISGSALEFINHSSTRNENSNKYDIYKNVANICKITDVCKNIFKNINNLKNIEYSIIEEKVEEIDETYTDDNISIYNYYYYLIVTDNESKKFICPLKIKKNSKTGKYYGLNFYNSMSYDDIIYINNKYDKIISNNYIQEFGISLISDCKIILSDQENIYEDIDYKYYNYENRLNRNAINAIVANENRIKKTYGYDKNNIL